MNAAAILDACEPETDPDRRGAQVLLAVARSVWPRAGLPELVAKVGLLDPQAAGLNPAMVADVARRMGLGS